MVLVEIDTQTQIDTDSIAKVAFVVDASNPLAERADLFGLPSATLTLLHTAGSIPALQKLREVIGDGTGGNGWVRIREPGTTDDNTDSYANIRVAPKAEFGRAPDGEIAQLQTAAGTVIGEVHLPEALRKLRERNR